MAVALWMLVLVVLFTALGVYFGDQYNALNYLELPNWLTQIDMDERTTTGIIAAVASVVLVFLAAALGGKLGEKYHARVDADLVREDRATVVS
jgi:hypothetical protein